MNKKIITISIIILVIAVIVGGFWYTKNQKNTTKPVDIVKDVQNDAEQKEDEVVSKNEDGNSKMNSGQRLENKKHLSDKEINNLKKQKKLVWYEVPEIGIRFLVTLDAKKDLRYNISSTDQNIIHLYKQSVINFHEHDWCFKNGKNTCIEGSITRISNKDLISARQNKIQPSYFCNNNSLILKTESDSICFTATQASNFSSNEEYDEYLKMIKDKTISIYLETAQIVK